MKIRILSLLGAAAILVGALVAPAVAEQNVPGTVLVFPSVDTTKTIISITNTYMENWEGPQSGVIPDGNVVCDLNDPGSPRYGETGVHLLFFEKSGDEGLNCQHFDFSFTMSPQDHASFIGEDVGFPANRQGFLVAFAVDVTFPNGDDNPDPWNFDFLAGQAWHVDAGDDFGWSYNAYAFLSGLWDDPGTGTEACDRHHIDANNVGYLDFDGTELEQWGDDLLLPRFFEEANDGATKDSLLVLISPLNTFEDQRNFEVTFSSLFWNNDENGHGFPFSRTKSFTCQFTGPLRGVSAQFEELGGTAGAPELDTGWGIFDGYEFKDDTTGELVNTDPPLLGVFIQHNTPGNSRFSSSTNFFTRGFNGVDAQVQYLFGISP